MPDPNLAHLISSLILALLTGMWQPAPADIVTATQPQPVQFSATWHPQDQVGNEQDYYVVAADGSVFAGATSSAVSPAKH
jgi:hypothetical protein